MKTITRVYGGICLYIFIVVLWHGNCFLGNLKAAYSIEALKKYFEELQHTNYSMASVQRLWGSKAKEWTEILLADEKSYWKTKYKALLSAAISDRFLGYNKLAFRAATNALRLQPGSMNIMIFLEDFYRALEIHDREKACRKARKMVIEASVTAEGWLAIEKCMGL